MMKEFRLFDSPLSGTNLIEASAGTGKTYAISMIFLRLIVEKNFRIDEILTVTFTVPATMELRQRIRSVLREAMDVLEGRDVKDVNVQGYMNGYREKNDVRHRIITALKSFDEAAVYTIHSFCQQILADNAFESGSLFNSEIINDDDIIRLAAADFCRKTLYEKPAASVAFFMEYCGFDELIELYKKRPLSPELHVKPDVMFQGTEILDELYLEIQSLYAELTDAWFAESAQVEDILHNSEALNRNSYRPGSMDSLVESMNSYLSGGNPLAVVRNFGEDKFRNYTQEKISSSTKKGYKSPESPVFEICGRLYNASERYIEAGKSFLVNMKKELFAYIDGYLLQKKSVSSRRTYDDLIRDAHSGLGSSRNFAVKVNSRYMAALIDEFQDTDDLQFEIFSRLFNTGKTILFLIGDPKQAIYRFRGADIYSYIMASGLMEKRYTLTKNWRSSSELIEAVNLLFGQCSNPFIFERISYHTISAGDERQNMRFMKSGKALPPLDIWLGTGSDDAGVKTGDVLLRELAAEISRIIHRGSDNPYTIEDKRINPGDIAVLVRTRKQAVKVRNALAGFSIPSSSRAMDSVFSTEEARSMHFIVSAIADPSNYRLVRAAASTPVMGFDAAALYGLTSDAADEGAGIDALTSRFYEYRETWNSSGFIAMFSMFLEGESVPARLFSLKGGERMMTDISHISEILHNEEHENGFSPGELVSWFARTIASPPGDDRDDKYSMRIERDDEAVNILTMHSCKGLEFPVVYCPFLAHAAMVGKDHVIYHDPSDNKPVLYLDKNIPPEVKILRDEEDLAENVRLLYVALTRAKYRCRVMLAPNTWFPRTAAHYIFVKSRGYTEVQGSKKSKIEIIVDALSTALGDLAENSGGRIGFSVNTSTQEIMYRPEEPYPENISVRKFSGEIKESWRTFSYSSIAHGSENRLEDRDFIPGHRAGTGTGIFAFPSGTRAGLCIHEVFEKNDFTVNDRDTVASTCRNVLGKYRFGESWDVDLADMFLNVTGAVLDPDTGLRLGNIDSGSRQSELEFDFPVEFFDTGGFREVFRGGGYYCEMICSALRGNRPGISGMMKGFIDLVFVHAGKYYIADWKSNHLGNAYSDYDSGRILLEMEKHNYFLQYHLYSLALHRYLGQRMGAVYSYEKYFGGVYYFFVRGMKPGSVTGIFADRPGHGIIEKLDLYFKGEK